MEITYLKEKILFFRLKVSASVNNHVLMQTLYEALTVCENMVELYKFDIDYSCNNINYTVKRQNFMQNFYQVFDDSKLFV